MPKTDENRIGSNVPVFYDCEASGLDGVPIEIGWAFIDTSTGEIQSESHLVKPPLHWDMQPVWDPDAEKLHGIPLKQLHEQGRPPFEVGQRMNEVLAGRAPKNYATFKFQPLPRGHVISYSIANLGVQLGGFLFDLSRRANPSSISINES